MNDLAIFILAAIFGVALPSIGLFRLIFKKSIAFLNAVILVENAVLAAILAYFVAKTNLFNIIWAGPLAIFNNYLVIIWFQRSAIKPLKRLTDTITKLSEGNFSVEFDSKIRNKQNEVGFIATALSNLLMGLRESKEIADLVSQGKLYSADSLVSAKSHQGDLDKALQAMVDKLMDVIHVINQSTSTIASGANQINNSSESVATGANEQAASIEEISTSMEQMLATINQNAENSKHTEQIAQKNSESIDIVYQVSEQAIKAIKHIVAEIDAIKEIAQKTDLLAINAAIEAARAGEHGKGFAVVAGEIRKLAETTQKTAVKITELAKSTVNEASHSGELLAEVIPEIKKTQQLVLEISASSAEQHNGANQVNSAISQLNMVTQENAASSEQLSTGAAVFLEQAKMLQDSISFFKLSEKKEKMGKDELLKKIAEMNRIVEQEFSESEITPTTTQSTTNSSTKNLAKKMDGIELNLEDDLDDDFVRIK